MLLLPSGTLSATWSKFALALLRDLEPIGYDAQFVDGELSVRMTVPIDLDSVTAFWARAHRLRHRLLLAEHADSIRAFESSHGDVFTRMDRFQPSTVQPTLQIVDFSSDRDRSIVEYLRLYQSVTTGRRVGRQMGLLVWDDGQTAHRPLIGAAVLTSPRYSQRLRDHYLGWTTHRSRASPQFDEDAKRVREDGLARMMQLSMVCALRPYSKLAGARLVAMAPFTEVGQQAFASACKSQADPDLAAIVTTSGKGPSGFPFRRQRVGQLSNNTIQCAPGAKGEVFTHIRPSVAAAPLYASFENLVSVDTIRQARELFEDEQPQRAATAKDVDRVAISYALRRLGMSRRIFRGNEVGVHIGMLGHETMGHLSCGTPRPTHGRPRLKWSDVVNVWTNAFLPPSTGSPVTATAATQTGHIQGRRRRNQRGRSFPQEQIPLSYDVEHPDDPV